MAARKTARERAQDELDTAERVLARAKKRAESTAEDLKVSAERYEALLVGKREEAEWAATALQEAQERRDFLASHPALKAEKAGDDTLL